MKTRRFTVNPSLEDLTLKALFLLVLASGRRVGELHSLIRRKGFIVFSEHYNWVRLHPNPQFLAKNETASFRRGPILINAFKDSSNNHDVLCPVNALRTFLAASRGFNIIPCSLIREHMPPVQKPGSPNSSDELSNSPSQESMPELMTSGNLRPYKCLGSSS